MCDTCGEGVREYVVFEASGRWHSHHDEDDLDVAQSEATAINGQVYEVCYTESSRALVNDYTP